MRLTLYYEIQSGWLSHPPDDQAATAAIITIITFLHPLALPQSQSPHLTQVKRTVRQVSKQIP